MNGSRIKRWYNHLLPPENWRLPVIITLGILNGFGFFIFYISNAPSYLSDDPRTCVNCHIMSPQYATWAHSSHREVAVCNDCHVPHNNFLNKYFFKAKDGMRHATIFTLRAEPQTIFIKPAGVKVVQQNCIRCHDQAIRNNKVGEASGGDGIVVDKTRLCWECHRETPHGRVNSLSSVPFARVPLPGSPVPDWLRRITGNKE